MLRRDWLKLVGGVISTKSNTTTAEPKVPGHSLGQAISNGVLVYMKKFILMLLQGLINKNMDTTVD